MISSHPVRLLIADDHNLIRESLSEVLNRCSSIEVVATARDGGEAAELAYRHKPDVALLDVEMPGMSSFLAAGRILADNPDTKVIFISAYDYDIYISQALDAQARGYLLKDETKENLIEAVQCVVSGRTFFSSHVQSRLVIDGQSRIKLRNRPKTRLETLTNKEKEVLRLVAKGLRLKDVAQKLNVSYKTVDNQKTSVMRKLDIKDRVELTRFAIREGLVDA